MLWRRGEKIDPLAFSWLFFQWLTSINMNSVTRYVVFHMALVKPQLHHTPPALFGALGTLPLRNCVAAVPERSTQASHSNQPPPAIFLTANNQSFSLTVPLNMFQPPPLKRLKYLSSSWSVAAIGYVAAARTGMMTLKNCPYLTYFKQLSISNGQWTAFFKIELQIPLKLSFHNH